MRERREIGEEEEILSSGFRLGKRRFLKPVFLLFLLLLKNVGRSLGSRFFFSPSMCIRTRDAAGQAFQGLACWK